MIDRGFVRRPIVDRTPMCLAPSGTPESDEDRTYHHDVHDTAACFICDKHQQCPAAVRIHADDLGIVTHASGDRIYHGYLYLEPHRGLTRAR